MDSVNGGIGMTAANENENTFPGALTVTELNKYVKGILENTLQLRNVYVKGEISNYKRNTSGHLYFSLKDAGGQITAVMFRGSAAKLKFEPENGMKVTAHCHVSVYVEGGSYQIIVESLEPDGIGALALAYEQLRRRLEKEGLFDASRKKKLPKIPRRVGIITSPTGAAVRDMINVCGRRFPYAELVLYPSAVQGSEAAGQLAAGVGYFNAVRSVDVIIIGRGGGSIEDLWAFNEEQVVRAVAASAIPIISAVGHETDFTLCDFAADVRAPTPSAAAELAVPDTAKLKIQISNIVTHSASALSARLHAQRQRLDALSASRALRDPMNFIDDKRLNVDNLYDRILRSETTELNLHRAQLSQAAASLNALNPLAVISRGYSAVYREDGHLVKSVDEISPGDRISFRTTDGHAVCTVDETVRDDGGQS